MRLRKRQELSANEQEPSRPLISEPWESADGRRQGRPSAPGDELRCVQGSLLSPRFYQPSMNSIAGFRLRQSGSTGEGHVIWPRAKEGVVVDFGGQMAYMVEGNRLAEFRN